MEFEKIKRIIAEALNIDESVITPESRFSEDLGADSLDVFQIILEIEKEFDIVIETEEAERIVTVKDAADALKLGGHA